MAGGGAAGEHDLAGAPLRVVAADHESVAVGFDRRHRGVGQPRAELRRLFRWLKEKGVTAVITGERGEETLTRQGLEEYVSDCVIVLDHRVSDQSSSRRLRVVKYRGSTHGTNEKEILASLPQKFKEMGVDAAISCMAC